MSPINFEYRKQLIAEIPDLLKCFQCGTCTAACQANKYGGAYSPRQKILAAQYGNKSIINAELWRCVTCNSCNERCPQEVNPYEVLIKLKNIAYRDGIVDESYGEAERTFASTGRLLPISDAVNTRRASLGLKEFKPVEELVKLLKK